MPHLPFLRTSEKSGKNTISSKNRRKKKTKGILEVLMKYWRKRQRSPGKRERGERRMS
jgi:hypothetical protein